MNLTGKYKFLEEIIPTYKDFSYTKQYKEFDKIDKLDTYAIDKNKKFINTYNKPVYIGILPMTPSVNMANAGFIFEKI